MANKNDFKLTAGLHIDESATQIKQDIKSVEAKLKQDKTHVEIIATTKFNVTEVRQSLKKAIGNSKQGVQASIGTKFNPDEIKKSLTAALNATSNMPKLSLQVDVNTTTFQQSIQTAVNHLPSVLLNVDVNPTSLQNLLKGLTKQLDLKLSPKNSKGSSNNSYGGYTGRQLSTFNQLDKVAQKFYVLENIPQAIEDHVDKVYKNIYRTIERASNPEEFDSVLKDITNFENIIKNFQARTLDKRELAQIQTARDAYQDMYASLKNIGEEHSLLGQYLQQELNVLKQASGYSSRTVLDSAELSSIKEAINGQKDYASAVQSTIKRLQQLEELRLKAKTQLNDVRQSIIDAYGPNNASHSDFWHKLDALDSKLQPLLHKNGYDAFNEQKLNSIKVILDDIVALKTEMSTSFQGHTISDAMHIQVSRAVTEYEKLYDTIVKAGREQSEFGQTIASNIQVLKTAGIYDSKRILDDDLLKKVNSALSFVEQAKVIARQSYYKQTADIVTKSSLNNTEHQLDDLKKSLQKMSGLDTGLYIEQIDNVLQKFRAAQDWMSKPVWNTHDEQRALKLKEAIDQVIESTKKYQDTSRAGFKTLNTIEARAKKLSGHNVQGVIDELRKRLTEATSADDFKVINDEIQKLDDRVALFEKKTFDDQYRNKLRSVIEEYQALLRIVKDAGDENGLWGQQLQKTIDYLADVFGYSDNHVFADDEILRIHNIVDGLKDTKTILADLYKVQPQKAFNRSDLIKASDKLEPLKESLRKLGNVDGVEVRHIDAVLKSIEKYQYLKSKSVWNTHDEKLALKLKNAIDQVTLSANKYKKAINADFFNSVNIGKFESLHNDLKKYVADNSKALSNADLRHEFEYLSNLNYWSLGASKKGIVDFENKINSFKAAVHQAGLETKTFSDRVKELFTGITLSGVISRLGDNIIRIFRNAIENVKILDSAMTELKKVTDESNSYYNQFMNNAKSQAKEVGATLSDVIYSTADFARLGYSIEEASELSRVSTIYKNVGDGFENVTESSEALISIMKAFGVEAENVIDIADKLNKIGNENAISSGGLGRALQNSAAALMEAGASMEEAMALVTGANGVIQDPSQVGAGLRTISLRLRGTKVELEEMGEDAAGAAESTSKLREQVLALAGVDVMKNASEYKGVYQILQEISKVWKDISDVDQAALLELLAGKNRSNILASLLNNFDDAEEALDDAMNAEGSALRENEKILNSIQGKLNQFTAAWESLSHTIINSDFLKTLIQSGTKLVTILDKIIDGVGVLPTVLGSLVGVGTYSLFDKYGVNQDGQTSILSALKTSFNNLSIEFGSDDNKTNLARNKARKQLEEDTKLLKQFWKHWKSSDNQADAANDVKQMSDAARLLANELSVLQGGYDEFNKKLNQYTLAQNTYIDSIKETTFGTKLLQTGTNMLLGTVASLVSQFILMTGIEVGKWLWNNVITTNAAKEAMKEYAAELAAMQRNQDDVADLAQELNNLKDKTNLTVEETERYYEIQNQLKDLIPGLQGYYNAQHDFIITESTDVKNLINYYEQLIATKQRDIEVEYRRKSLFGSEYDKDKKRINDYQNQLADLNEYVSLNNKLAQGESLTEDEWIRRADLSGLYSLDTTEEALEAIAEIESALTNLVDSVSTHVQNALFSLEDVFKDEKFDYNAANLAVNAADSATRLAWYEGAMSNDVKVQQSTIDAIKGSVVYKEASSGKYDSMDETTKAAVVDAGGLRHMNAVAAVYKAHQDDIIDGTYQFTGILKESNLEGVRAYLAWLDAQSKGKEVIEASTDAIDVSIYSNYGDAVNSLGEAYVQFLEDGKVSLDTLAELQETFGSYTDEWDNLMTTLSSDDSTTSDVKKSVEDLAEAYLNNKLALGEVTTQNKAHIQSMLEQIGVKNAKAVVDQAEQQLIQANAIAIAQEIEARGENIQTTEELQQAVLEACIAKGMEEGLAQKVAESLGEETAVKKAAAMDKSFRDATQEEIDKLIEELALVKANATEIAQLQRVKAARAAIEQAESTGVWTPQIEAEQEWLNQFYDQVDKAQNEKVVVESDVSGTDAVGKYAKEAAGKVSEAFQKMYDELQFMREANLISEAEYLARLAKLNEQYNKNNLALYRKYALEIFNGMKANMKENLTEQYDAQIKAYEEQIDALNEQKEETEKYYDDLIESEQEKLDLLKEEWETEEYLLKIEQARAALARAQQQKSVRIYREGRGFAWEQDQEAVHDAQTEVNEAIQEYNRYLQELAIEKQIEKLEKLKEAAIETIEEQIKALEKAKEAAQKAKEQALKDLEEMKFNGEMFLQFLEESGIKIDEDLKKVIASFTDLSNMSADELKALEDALGETEGSVEGFGKTFQNVLLETGEDVEGFDGQVSNLQDTINNLEGKDIEIKVTTKYETEGTPSPYSEDVVITVTPTGSSPANKIAGQLPTDRLGTNDVPAFASGVINLPRSVNALTDELGPELVIPGQGTFRKLKMGTSVLPADISKNLWTIGQNPVGFASSIASMITNRNESNKTYQVNVGDIVLHEVQNARRVADELKGLVLKAEQLAFSK